MTTVVVSVEMDDSLRVISDIFHNTRFHHILVLDENKLVGVISDRDLLQAISPHIGTPSETTRDLATLNKSAHQIMSRNPITITPKANFEDAILLFNSHTVSCLPVTDESNKVFGIITWRDIFKSFSGQSR
ncbi:MAG: CBS domain-containing protein [Candidatus Reddybacter sp.]